MISPFLVGFTNICTGWVEKTPLTKVHVLYPDLMLTMTKDDVSEGWNENKLIELQYKIEEFQSLLVRTFGEHCNSGLYILKFHLLDHVVEDLRLFGTLSVLDASRFEQYSVSIKQATDRLW